MPKQSGLDNRPRTVDERNYQRALDDTRKAIKKQDLPGVLWGIAGALIARNMPVEEKRAPKRRRITQGRKM